MAANSGVVGVLRALLTADTAQFDTGMRKAVVTTQTTTKAIGGLGNEVSKLTPQAERMVKAFGGDRLLAQANNLVAAVQKVGGAATLTEAQQRRVNATVTEAIAKYKALGQAAPESMIALASATRRTASPLEGLSASLSKMNSLLGVFGVSLGAGALVGFSRELLHMGDELVRVADQTGLTTEEVQKFQFIAKQSGNSVEQITTAISFLQKNLGATGKELENTRKNVEALGLNFEQLRTATPFEQMSEIADAIGKIPDPAARARAAFELFGRSGTALLPTLTAQFKALGDAAPVMSDQIVRELDKAGDALDKFGLQVKVWAAEAFNSLSRGFDLLIKWDLQAGAAFQRWGAAALEAAGKIPGLGTALEKLGLSAKASREGAQWLTDAANAQQSALDRVAEPARRAAGGVTQFGDASEVAGRKASAAAQAARDMADEFKRQMSVANATFESIDKIDRDMLESRRSMSEKSAAEQERIAQQTAQKQLETFLQLNQSLIGLDAERMRAILAQNAPGTGIWKETGATIGDSVSGEIRKKLLNAFEDIPHFLTSSLLHSGSFLNGLKALGVSMADAIVEPLIKEMLKKIAGARLAAATASAVSGGSVAASAATTAASAGATAGVGGGAGGAGFLANPAFWTNPWTIGIAGGIALGTLAWKKGWFGLNKGGRANDARDKFLAQFSAFDTKRDSNNPPGFYGLDALLTKYKHHDWFTALIGARDPKSVRRAEEPIAAFMASLGRNVKMFNMGGFVPAGVVQPAILHGGSFGEDITPRRGPGGGAVQRIVNLNINIEGMVDRGNVRKFFREVIIPETKQALLFNTDSLATSARAALDR